LTLIRDIAPKRLLGFDFGEKNIGVAVGQMVTCTAQPLTSLRSRDGKPDWSAIASLVGDWKPDALVVGIPYHMDGNRQPMTDAAERFCRQLEGRFGLPVHTADERLSSRQAASRQLDGKEDIDALAAQIILESWMTTRSMQP
jgi:putative Holliday junction resolvase